MTSAVSIEEPYSVVCSTSDENVWLAARRTGLGASEAAAVCGESEWDSPYAIWARKAGLIGEKDETEPMRWGKLLEPVILAEYSRRTKRGAKPHGVLIRSKEYPWALATLDGETWDGAANDTWPLEIKNSSAFGAEAWEEGAPRQYYLQTQQQMLVTEKPKATISCLLGGNRLVWCDVQRDEIAIRKIVAHGAELWDRICDKEPPPVDGHDATTAALKQMFPKDEAEIALLPASMIAVADELENQKALAKMCKERVAELQNRLIAEIKSAERAILPDGRGFSYKLQKRASYTVAATEYRVLLAKKAKQ